MLFITEGKLTIMLGNHELQECSLLWLFAWREELKRNPPKKPRSSWRSPYVIAFNADYELVMTIQRDEADPLMIGYCAKKNPKYCYLNQINKSKIHKWKMKQKQREIWKISDEARKVKINRERERRRRIYNKKCSQKDYMKFLNELKKTNTWRLKARS